MPSSLSKRSLLLPFSRDSWQVHKFTIRMEFLSAILRQGSPGSTTTELRVVTFGGIVTGTDVLSSVFPKAQACPCVCLWDGAQSCQAGERILSWQLFTMDRHSLQYLLHPWDHICLDKHFVGDDKFKRLESYSHQYGVLLFCVMLLLTAHWLARIVQSPVWRFTLLRYVIINCSLACCIGFLFFFCFFCLVLFCFVFSE